MKLSRRRTILRVIALLLVWGAAGATLNVAVAWGCAVFAPREVIPNMREFWKAHEVSWQREWWPLDKPDGYPHVPDRFHLERGMGSELTVAIYISRGTEHWFAAITRAGWPMPSCRGEVWGSSVEGNEHPRWAIMRPYSTGGYKTCLPLQPLWPGFAINTVFYAGVLWVLFCGPFALRRMIRRRRGQCANCAYPIGQNERCTECGAAISRTSRTLEN